MPKRYAGGIITATFKPLDPHGDNNSLYVWGNGYIGEMGLNDRFVGRSSPVLVDSGVTWSKVFGSANANWRLAIKQNGTMWAWGQNDDGQLGNNTRSKRSSPTQIGALTTWVTGTVGGSSGGSTAAIKTDGTLWTWGKSAFGELGSNSVASRSSPVQVGNTPTAASTWSQIASHNDHTLALQPDGSLWAWGEGSNGRLGNNASGYSRRSSPIQVGLLSTWSQIAAGEGHSAAIKTDGTMWLWGSAVYGGLGNSSLADKSSPVQIGALTTWSKITCSDFGTMAIKTDGTLWAWGENGQGLIGDETTERRSSPVQVGALTTWTSIDNGGYHALALQTDGSMWTWGRADGGVLANNTGFPNHRSSPAQIGSLTTWSKIATGYQNSMAIKTDGTLWIWGAGAAGRLGINDVNPKSSPVQVGALTNWSQIAGGGQQIIATKNDGTLWTWGRNGEGGLGDNTVVYRSSPVQVGSLTTWSKVAAGTNHTLAIETDGSLYSWGENDVGQLGDSTVANKSSPVQVGAQVYGWSLVSRGGYVSAAIRADGTLWAWGRNQVGQLGQNNTVLRSSPVQVGTDTNWSKVSVAANSILAIKTDNSLWVWGYQDQGVLGINSVTPVSSPVQVGATTDWSLISATRYHAGAIKTNGTFWTWGQSTNHGQLGLGDRDNRSSPVQLGSDTNWSQVSAGTNTTAATKTIGTLYVWGDGRHGEMGDISLISRSSPIQVGSLTSWADVSVGSDDSAQAIFAISSIPF